MSEIWGDVWGLIWLFFWIFVLFAYLSTLINVVVDLFRDAELGGGWKAIWILALMFVPLVTVLIYVIARGRGMAERSRGAAAKAQQATTEYIRQAAGTSPAEQIATAKQLLADGTITQAEFEQLKAKALA
ncbi:MAG: SHOCT domain-containing protein [Microcella sp.]